MIYRLSLYVLKYDYLKQEDWEGGRQTEGWKEGGREGEAQLLLEMGI